MALTNVMQAGSPITDVTTIADRLREARNELGLSQDDVARLAGVSPGTIGNIENGTRLNPRSLLEIAAAVRVKPEWLKSGKPPKQATTGPSGQPAPAAAAAPALSGDVAYVTEKAAQLDARRMQQLLAAVDMLSGPHGDRITLTFSIAPHDAAPTPVPAAAK